MDNTWINTREASKRLGVSPQRIRIYIAEGRLPATKIGKQWLIDPDRLGDVKVKAPGRPKVDYELGLDDYELGPDQDDQVFNRRPRLKRARKKIGGRPA